MPGYIQIEGDPTWWMFEQSVDVGEHREEALSIQVYAPLIGTLVLSPKAQGVHVSERQSEAAPNLVDNLHPVIYVPTHAGPSTGDPGHELPSSANLSDLARQIAVAMREGHRETVALARGTLDLDGATLAFAVVAPALPPLGTDAVPHDSEPPV
jgi:hypothetical protein